ncbi:MAG: hypothetical protein H6721_03765 [Sandaracinus sp.]|nr:hypothetical protein [Myxococcales bacterium]MCB9603654.1 hypothetical protein [Sandaracinus sp.]MCB9621439.1 hypothetical protein [Sandaracinus sp.]MCB9631247.1 hypothetical protein [Sandaracinus sp.]
MTRTMLPAAALCLLATATLAQPRGGPPAAAFEACEDKARGDACSFTDGDRTMSGTCGGPEDRPLACGPSRPHGPPPEAFEACEGIESGDACVVDTPDGTVEGTCEDGPSGRACRLPRPSR